LALVSPHFELRFSASVTAKQVPNFLIFMVVVPPKLEHMILDVKQNFVDCFSLFWREIATCLWLCFNLILISFKPFLKVFGCVNIA